MFQLPSFVFTAGMRFVITIFLSFEEHLVIFLLAKL